MSPLNKMKALHWKRMLIKDTESESLWKEVEKGPAKKFKLTGSTEKEFARLYTGVAAPRKGKKGRTEDDDDGDTEMTDKKKEVRVIDDKRFNQLAIFLRAMPPTEIMIKVRIRFIVRIQCVLTVKCHTFFLLKFEHVLLMRNHYLFRRFWIWTLVSCPRSR